MTHISEFPLPAPILSYCIISAQVCKVQYTTGSDDLFVCNESDGVSEVGFGDEIHVTTAHVIKMFAVQPKSLQQCTITYQSQDMDLVKQVSASQRKMAKYTHLNIL